MTFSTASFRLRIPRPGAAGTGTLLLFISTAQVGIAIITYRWKSNLHD